MRRVRVLRGVLRGCAETAETAETAAAAAAATSRERAARALARAARLRMRRAEAAPSLPPPPARAPAARRARAAAIAFGVVSLIVVAPMVVLHARLEATARRVSGAATIEPFTSAPFSRRRAHAARTTRARARDDARARTRARAESAPPPFSARPPPSASDAAAPFWWPELRCSHCCARVVDARPLPAGDVLRRVRDASSMNGFVAVGSGGRALCLGFGEGAVFFFRFWRGRGGFLARRQGGASAPRSSLPPTLSLWLFLSARAPPPPP